MRAARVARGGEGGAWRGAEVGGAFGARAYARGLRAAGSVPSAWSTWAGCAPGADAPPASDTPPAPLGFHPREYGVWSSGRTGEPGRRRSGVGLGARGDGRRRVLPAMSAVHRPAALWPAAVVGAWAQPRALRDRGSGVVAPRCGGRANPDVWRWHGPFGVCVGARAPDDARGSRESGTGAGRSTLGVAGGGGEEEAAAVVELPHRVVLRRARAISRSSARRRARSRGVQRQAEPILCPLQCGQEWRFRFRRFLTRGSAAHGRGRAPGPRRGRGVARRTPPRRPTRRNAGAWPAAGLPRSPSSRSPRRPSACRTTRPGRARRRVGPGPGSRPCRGRKKHRRDPGCHPDAASPLARRRIGWGACLPVAPGRSHRRVYRRPTARVKSGSPAAGTPRRTPR